MNRFLCLRKFYDWFNNCSYLNILLDGSNSTNGPPGGGLVYFSPIGKSEDLVVTERYFDQEYYINELKNENPLLRKSCLMRLSMSEYVDLTMAIRYVQDVSEQTDRVIENSRKYLIQGENIA